MKRDKETYPKVKPYKSYLFWNECRFCHKEFRKEQGFKIIDYKACKYGEESPFFTSYCCNDCANSIEEVKSKIHKEKDDSNRKRYDILNKIYKDEHSWNNTKETYQRQLKNSKDIKERGSCAIILSLMNKFEEIEKGDDK